MGLLQDFAAEAESGDGISYEVDPYSIISILLDTLCFGMFSVLFILSTLLLLQRRRAFLRENVVEKVKLRSLMFYLVTSVLMFLFITVQWLFWWPEVLPIGGLPHLPRLSRTAYRFKEVMIKLSVLLGDTIATYRLWILSNRNKVMIVFPVLGLFGFLACTIALSGPANKTGSTLRPVIDGKLVLAPWDIAVTLCTLSVTIYVTLMITWIILRSRFRVSSNVLESGVKRALVIIIESAALCTTWNLFFFIAGLGFRSELALSILDCMPGVYGISVMLINARVGLGWARSYDERLAASNPSGTASTSARRNFPRATTGEQRGIYISTVVYTEPSGPVPQDGSDTATGDIELGDKKPGPLAS